MPEMSSADELALVAAANPFTVLERGWIHGTWYCGTSWRKAEHYGAYPHGLVDRIRRCFPGRRTLHLCSGRANVKDWVNVDLFREYGPSVVADAERLPFTESVFDVCIIDPPYSTEDASRYGVRRLVSSGKVLDEAWRVLKLGGWMLWLDEMYPSYRRTEWKLTGLIGVATGFQRRARWLCFLRKRGAKQLKLALMRREA